MVPRNCRVQQIQLIYTIVWLCNCCVIDNLSITKPTSSVKICGAATQHSQPATQLFVVLLIQTLQQALHSELLLCSNTPLAVWRHPPSQARVAARRAMQAEDVLNEPLFFNRQIAVPVNASAGSTAQQPLMPQEHTILLTAGITKVAHVQAALQPHQPQALTACMHTVLLAMPTACRQFSFFNFFWGTGGMSILRRQSTDRDTELT